MSFLNPGLLYGLAALVIPLLVLLLFRKKIVLNWAAYEWMAKATQRKHKQHLIDDLLKLLAKLLLLAILVLLMARPAVNTGGGGNRLLVIDVTPSMGTVLDNGTRLTRARKLAREYLEQAPGSTAVAAYDGTLIPLSPLSDSPDPSVVDAATLTGGTGTFEQFVKSLLALDSLGETPEILFYTDAQRAHFEDPDALKRLLEPLAGTRIVLVPVESRGDVLNAGITRLSAPGEGYLPGRANVLEVTVRNFSSSPMDAVPLIARVGNEVQDRVTLSLPAGSEQNVGLLVATPPGGNRRIRVELPPDPYPADNEWLLVASPPETLKILAVSPAPGEDPFEYDVFFESAVRAYVPEDHLVYQRVRPHQLLRLRLENYDAVVTFGVPLPTKGGISQLLTRYVRDGGALLAFSDLNHPQDGQALGVASTLSTSDPASPDPDRLPGTLLDFMAGPELDPSRIRFLRYAGLTSDDGTGLLYVEGEKNPILMRVTHGRGHAVLAGFLPYPGYTDLVYNPNTVQITMRMLRQALPQSHIRSYSGRELKGIDISDPETDGRYILQFGDEPASRLEILERENAPTVLSGAPRAENGFGEVRLEDETLFELGYNVTREDSAIAASAPTDLEPVLSDTLQVRSEGGNDSNPMRLEHAGLMAVLLLLAMSFDTYAHLWRRS